MLRTQVSRSVTGPDNFPIVKEPVSPHDRGSVKGLFAFEGVGVVGGVGRVVVV